MATTKTRVTRKTVAKVSQSEPRAERPKIRVPVNGQRDKLSVYGLSPDFFYRFVKDNSEDGQRIFTFLRAGYDFVQADEVTVGQEVVYSTENVGSIVRQPAGDGTYLYLMKLPMALHQEDERAKAAEIDSLERQMTRARNPDDDENKNYGSNKLSYEIK